MAVGEWDERQLCPDGACVGLIGPDGTCKVCGRAAPNWGDERKRGLIDPPDDDEDDDDEDNEDDDHDGALVDGDEDDLDDEDDEGDDDEDDDLDDEDDEADDEPSAGNGTVRAASVEPAPGSPADWGSRLLCPDGACIGVIGGDGRCKVCGRRATDIPSSAVTSEISNEASGEISARPASRPADPVAPSPPVAAPKACNDPACSGVAGPEGNCTVCGKLVA